MYIISKYKDYYDGAVGMGIDKSIVYERTFQSMLTPDHIKEKLQEEKNWRVGFTHQYGYNRIPKGKYNTYLVVIGFCGKLYPAIRTEAHDEKYEYPYYNEVHDIIYDVDQIKAFLDSQESNSDRYFKKSKTDVQQFEDYLNRIKNVDPLEIHREFNSPIFAYGYPPVQQDWEFRKDYNVEKSHGFFINPMLKDYKFAKVFDPYTAFQEIQMFISGVLPVGDDVDAFPYTEKQKVAQHGMDKWSFRKPPEK